MAYDAQYAIDPDTWTTISFPLIDGNPPFLSYGAGNFNSVFSNIQNLQLGLYLPASTTFTGLRFDIDNVAVSPVPEPALYSMFVVGGLVTMVAARRRRRTA